MRSNEVPRSHPDLCMSHSLVGRWTIPQAMLHPHSLLYSLSPRHVQLPCSPIPFSEYWFLIKFNIAAQVGGVFPTRKSSLWGWHSDHSGILFEGHYLSLSFVFVVWSWDQCSRAISLGSKRRIKVLMLQEPPLWMPPTLPSECSTHRHLWWNLMAWEEPHHFLNGIYVFGRFVTLLDIQSATLVCEGTVRGDGIPDLLWDVNFRADIVSPHSQRHRRPRISWRLWNNRWLHCNRHL